MIGLRRLVGAVVLLLATALPAFAQRPPPAQEALSLGARLGWGFELDAVVAGGFLRLAVPRTRLELQGTGDFTFDDQITDRQFTADVLFRVQPGLYLGGGPVFRSTRFFEEEALTARETRTGYSVFFSLGTSVVPDRSFLTGLELRWIFVDDLRPQTATVQIGLPLIRY